VPSPFPDLLDTNVLVHLIRDDRLGRHLKHERELLVKDVAPAFCIVTEGELRSLAHQFGWGVDKIDVMRFCLDYFRRIPIDTPETMEAYAAIDAMSKRNGINMGKNDVWIAAAAHVTGFELLTTDHDFDHLHPAILTRTLVERETS
jgi:tRNA(fMet)-specific endonuclease VapC